MADEHSFDVVCEVDMQEVTNAVTQAVKEISQRFDFKGSKSSIEFDKGKSIITVLSDDEQKMKSVIDILQLKRKARDRSQGAQLRQNRTGLRKYGQADNNSSAEYRRRKQRK